MCGRYSLDKEMDEILIRYKAINKAKEYKPKREIYPTDEGLVVLENEEREIMYMKWGFLTSFSKRPIINARSETIFEKATFKDSFLNRRCIIPIDSYYEWENVDGKKIKRNIRIEGDSIFSLAGIYNIFKIGDEKHLAYVIITTNANKKISHIHERMPAILSKENEDIWLNSKENNVNVLKDMLKSHDGDFIIG